MAHEEERIYRFADFTLEVGEHRLRRGHQEIYLRPKTFETLLYLVERHSHLVGKNELLDRVWADTIVTESTLTHCIEEVRKALADDVHHPRYIKTVPRVGYKFIAEVEEITSRSAAEEEEVEEEYTAVRVRVTEEGQETDGANGRMGEWANGGKDEPVSHSPILPLSLSSSSPALPLPHAPTLSRWSRSQKLLAVSLIVGLLMASGLYLYNESNQPINSLAVLPFINLTADPEQDYFADGVTDMLITDLAKLRALRVISRTSVMQYKGTRKPLPEIARELNVDAVVEGSVLRSGERVRITAQLIEAATEQHLWAESYERDLRDILALQSEVTQDIVSAIRATLTPQEQAHLAGVRSVNPEAHQAYLKGRYFWNKRTPEGFKKGIEYFQQAIEIDPTYALAYVGLADCYNMLNDYEALSPKDSAPHAKAAAMKALELDDTLAEAHASLGFALMHYAWDWPGAEREFQRAIQLNPNYADAHHWYGLYLTAMMRFDQAQAEMKRAQELDPLSLIINTNVGWLFYFARRYDQAVEQFRKTLEMDSTFTSARVKLGWAYEQQGMYEEAIAEFQKVLSLLGEAVLTELGHAYAVSERGDEAMKIIAKLKEQSKRRYVSPYWIAVIYAGLGEKTQAFDWLERAYENRCGWLAWLKVDPKMDSLRSDPRFAVLMKKVGLE